MVSTTFLAFAVLVNTIVLSNSAEILLGLEKPNPFTYKDAKYISCKKYSEKIKNFCSKTSGYHMLARVKCPAFCLHSQNFCVASNPESPNVLDDCSKGAAWLKPIAKVDKDRLGNDKTAFCTAVSKVRPELCTKRHFGYMCAKTCNVAVDAADS